MAQLPDARRRLLEQRLAARPVRPRPVADIPAVVGPPPLSAGQAALLDERALHLGDAGTG